MRLDEWQKYIDSQFLDEEPEPAPAPKPSNVSEVAASLESPPQETVPKPSDGDIITQEALFTAVFAEESELPTLTSSETGPNVVQNMVTMIVAPPQSPALPLMGRTPRIEVLTPLPETSPETKPASPTSEEVTNRTRRRSQVVEASSDSSTDTPFSSASPSNTKTSESPAPTIQFDLNTADLNVPKPTTDGIQPTPVRENLPLASGLFEPISDLDTEIPVFQRYLPSSHAAAMPTEVPAVLQSLSLPPSLPETQAHAVVLKRDGDSRAPLASLPETQDSCTEDSIENTAEAQSDAPTDESLDRVRRAPKSRARHARNVRPENVPFGLSAAELWAGVPRHVQTLLSLERLEEKEVAQFSYKRQFQEKRHELIERLLDPILSLEDTARLLNVCPTTVRRYTNKGILTYYRKEPERSVRATNETAVVNEKETRQRRFRLSDILAFLETQQAAIESDRQAEHQAERRRLARASSALATSTAEPDSVSNVPSRGKDS